MYVEFLIRYAFAQNRTKLQVKSQIRKYFRTFYI